MSIFWRFGHTYLPSFEATVDIHLYPDFFLPFSISPILSPSLSLLWPLTPLITRGAEGRFWWAMAELLSHYPFFYPAHWYLSQSQSKDTSPSGNRPNPQIWRDEAHVASDKPLWSISWMHSESVEREALKIKPCPWCAQQWLCGQWSQRQPAANIKEVGAERCQLSTLIKHTLVNQRY